MADAQLDVIRLQAAMAFGQGAGAMLASPDAIQLLLERQGHLLENAARDWERSWFPFIELTRVMGQIAAARAAVNGRWQIGPEDVEGALQVALGPCPCISAARR